MLAQGETMKAPDVNTHFVFSFCKSILRIAGCIISLAVPNGLGILAISFLLAEIIGILEELC